MKKRILTGDRPSGRLHLGHYVGSLQSRVKLQYEYDQYIMIADVQALTDNFENPKKITENVFEVAKDYLSVGIDPTQTTIFVQSQIPEIGELTVYYLNLVTVGRLERNPTVKSEIQQKGYNDSIPAGFLCYPVSQAADITIFQAELVPVGDDQVPMIEQTNEIVRRFNRIYDSECLKECNAILSNTPRLVGIDGKAKASKSLGNAISLSDTQEEIKQKIFQMFTDPAHLKISDPGQVEGNVVFTYLDIFHPDKEEVESLKAHYKRGGLGDMTIKNILNNSIQDLLKNIREKRETIKQKDVQEILYHGTAKASQRAKLTMEEVREAIGVKYF
ncbi:MAG: tryptophan--tRNA ligase [Alphaproteobacteria bacterium]|jgi:tryptophanyl-tRNA synthetase|nr:tryptophan--tRNA ligase [Alphaproteobacteria bacterium]UCM93727.1 MAG: tryptophan--tRNA ligase [Candidatus Megaira endosymbiont of Mesostigma viride]HJK85360.1 tryptophan--tRNA ligase [Candidatus Megaera endosymbiont of Stentor roeselii]HJK88826.1 tryptophan--tRNA ligase [Candidatus Megaira endosymbiont of Mesostigma viride]